MSEQKIRIEHEATGKPRLWEKAAMLWAASPFIMIGLAILVPALICGLCAILAIIGGTIDTTGISATMTAVAP